LQFRALVVCRIAKSVAEVTVEEVLDHFQVNTIGPLALYQSTRALLSKSNNAKFIFISTVAASIDVQAHYPFNNTPYSVSKAALNTIGARLAVEEKDNMIVLMLHPGVVDTDMMKNVLEVMKVDNYSDLGVAIMTEEESAKNILRSVDAATHQDSGKFIDVTTGNVLSW
jgi:norsolorinic acid ketoreductase